MTRYWIIVASKDHVMRGVTLGIAQAGHGKRSGLARMRKGDGIVYYSPKEEFSGDKPLRAFTALGIIEDEAIYQVEESPDFKLFRRKVQYLSTKETAVQPLIDDLTVIRKKKSWGYMFRFGLFEIPEHDFSLIAGKMGVHTEGPVP